MNNEFIHISFLYVTTMSEDSAEKIAEICLNEKLAACVNIIPSFKSLYWWQGKIIRDSECILILKTDSRLISKLREKIKELHPSQTPCLAEFNLKSINTEYSDWIQNCLK